MSSAVYLRLFYVYTLFLASWIFSVTNRQWCLCFHHQHQTQLPNYLGPWPTANHRWSSPHINSTSVNFCSIQLLCAPTKSLCFSGVRFLNTPRCHELLFYLWISICEWSVLFILGLQHKIFDKHSEQPPFVRCHFWFFNGKIIFQHLPSCSALWLRTVL